MKKDAMHSPATKPSIATQGENMLKGPAAPKSEQGGGPLPNASRDHADLNGTSDFRPGWKGSAPQAALAGTVTEEDYYKFMETTSAAHTADLQADLDYRHARPGDGPAGDPRVRSNGQSINS